MHEGCECIGENQSALEAAKRMEQLDIGAMPICGQRHRLPHLVGVAQNGGGVRSV